MDILNTPAKLTPDPLRSALAGIAWPAIPDDHGAQSLALQFQLEQSQWLATEQLRALQLRQFARIFRHALTTVPYYRDLLAPWGDAGVASWQQYRELPVTARQAAQQAAAAIHSTCVPPAHGAQVRTQSSGSTGRPLVTLGTAWTQLMWRTLLLRDHLWHQRDLRGKLVAIRSKSEQRRIPNWGLATAAFVTGEGVVRGLSVDIDEQLQWLVQENPDYVLAHASNIQALAARSIELGIVLPRLKEARSYGEMLRPETRGLVRRAWGVKLSDSYSSEELGYIALQCPAGENYHVQAESLIVEVLDESGSPCAPGAIGQVVVTTLHNFAMPLIRYASGDFAEVAGPCVCGRGLPALRRIVGRQRNMLVRPDGVRHWPSFPTEVWGGIAPVLQIQLVQDAPDHVEVRVVMPRDFVGDEAARLTAALQECLAYPFRISFRRVDVIAPGAGGKYEDFVSLLMQ